MKPLLFILLGMLGFHALFTPPDSLISKVVIFKDSRDLHIGTEMPWRTPQATGFYLDTGNVRCAFIVTARHVMRVPDSTAGLHIHVVEASGNAYDEYIGDYRLLPGVVTHSDFWVDIALLANPTRPRGKETPSGFQIRDIVSREELQQFKPGSQALYIGMCLDSIGLAHNVYSSPEGSWLETFEPGRLIIDTTRELVWKADFALKIPGTPGVSGSPVLVKEGPRYRLVGIVNGFGVDESGRMVNVAYCTAAYRILEALADTSKERWISKGKERRKGNGA